jgi:hypothetical protein
MVSWRRRGGVVGKGEGEGVCGGQRRVYGGQRQGCVVGKGEQGGASKGLTRGKVSGWEE